MKARTSIDERRGSDDNTGGSKLRKDFTIMKKKNLTRLGGGGLSLNAFANAKSKHKDYNPAFIKKRKELYRNAKFVSKYKKSLKKDSCDCFPTPLEVMSENMNTKRKRKGNESGSLREVYEKKHLEMEKSRMERVKKMEDLKKVKGERKSMKQKMMGKTKWGQPLMKPRLQKLLDTILPQPT